MKAELQQQQQQKQKQRKPWKQKKSILFEKIERKNLKYCQYLSFSDKNK
jgi:hypothetical protein